MSATDERDPAPGAPDGPVGAAGAGSGVTGDPGPVEGPVAGAPQAAQEAGEPERALAIAQGSQSSEDDSDIESASIESASEQEEDREGARRLVIDTERFPLAGFRFMFLDMIYSMLQRIYHNDHILIRSHSGHVLLCTSPLDGSRSLPALTPPAEGDDSEGLAGNVEAAGEPMEPLAQAAVLEPKEAAAPEPRDQAAALQEVTGNQHGNSGEEAPKAGGEEEKQAKREKEDGEEQEPQKDLDPAVGSPGKSRLAIKKEKYKLKDILQDTLPGLLKTIKVIKNKQSQIV
ncbi:cancer/testis antigen 47A-like [Orycteropus afer afer]|uniref:Cancer/testis antigen 47A-like n=1 Tax=Orycteropus afer afer TaxID=1230840 RepID=A0A8B7AVF0_ORYAF|nr:cancer/testis antigen 47A-like [Orycteropus afer afer]